MSKKSFFDWVTRGSSTQSQCTVSFDAVEILTKLDQIIASQETMSITLADLQTALAAEKAEEDKILDLLQKSVDEGKSLHDQLVAAIATNDPAALQAVADQIAANTKAMADHVATM